MRNEEYGVRSENTSETEGASPFPTAKRRLSAEVEEIVSVQVLFPDRKTADIVVKELWEAVDNLQKKVEELKNKIT
jgi:hypothetical protein